MNEDRRLVTHVRATAENQRHVDADVVAVQHRVEVSAHIPGGHLPVSLRTDLVEQIFALPEVLAATSLHASIPLGDYELLSAFCERCSAVHARAAGATCLIEGELVADLPHHDSGPAER